MTNVLNKKWEGIFNEVLNNRFIEYFHTLYRHGYIHVGKDMIDFYKDILDRHNMPYTVEKVDSLFYKLTIKEEE